MVRYLGFYSNVCRGRRKKQGIAESEYVIEVEEYNKGVNKSRVRLILTKELLHTGITRAKESVVIFGKSDVLKKLCRVESHERIRFELVGRVIVPYRFILLIIRLNLLII